MKGYYCKVDRKNTTGKRDFLHVFAHEFCLEGFNYRAGDAVNFVIGQGDTMVTPLQLARAYGALSNGGKLMAPQVAKAVVSPDGKLIKEIKPKVVRRVKTSKSPRSSTSTTRCSGTPKEGTLAWKFGGFPLDKVAIRGKTGSAEVYGKQSTSWVATYAKDYVVIMMITQGGTGSGTSGPAVRKIWEHLYGIKGEDVRPSKAAIPGTTPPSGLPTFAKDGSILPPSSKKEAQAMTVLPMSRLAVSRSRVAVPRLDWVLLGAAGLILAIGTLLVWSATSTNDVLTQGDSTAYLHKHLVNILIGLVLAAAVMATDHRWVRIVTPLVYVASIVGLLLVLVMGYDDQRLALLADARRALHPAGRVRQAGGRDRDGDDRRRAHRELPPSAGRPGRRGPDGGDRGHPRRC